METLPYFKSDIPPGRSGGWSLERFEVRGEAKVDHRTHDVPSCARRRPGTYTRLKRGDEVFMTDLYDEWYTQKVAIDQACQRGGHVLIGGLGLGLVVESLLRTPDATVERITVVEKSPEVIELVAAHLLERYQGRLEVIEADVFTWQPPEGAHYSVIWHDIWPNPQAPETLPEMDSLEARYGPLSDWHGCWPREYRWIYEGLSWDREGLAV